MSDESHNVISSRSQCARILPWFPVFSILSFLCVADAFGQAVRLKVAYSSIGVGQSLVWVTKEAELFKENGLDVQLIFIGSSSTVTQAVIAGDVPIAIMSGSTAIGSQLAGADLVIAASTKKDPAQAFLVTGKGISQPAQLKGKKLAVSRLGASSDFILRVILKKLGLVPEKDVAIVQIGSSPVRMAALANGVADGTALTFEEMMVARKMGFNVLLNLMDFGVEALNSDVVTTRRFVRESRDTVQRFIKAMGLDVTDLYGALVRTDPNTHASVPATQPGCKVINATLKDIVVRSWSSDFQELAPVDLPIVANTRVFLPALAEEIKKQGKFSKNVVDERRKALSGQHARD